MFCLYFEVLCFFFCDPVVPRNSGSVCGRGDGEQVPQRRVCSDETPALSTGDAGARSHCDRRWTCVARAEESGGGWKTGFVLETINYGKCDMYFAQNLSSVWCSLCGNLSGEFGLLISTLFDVEPVTDEVWVFCTNH